MRWFTSDQHFGHERILILGEGRPFNSVQQMHSTIIRNWWEQVAPDDEVYLLGDLAMGNFEDTIKLLQPLPGVKYLVPGNHDKIFPKLNTDSRIEKFTPLYEEVGLTILPLWHTVTVDVDGVSTEVLLSHVPYSPERFEGRSDKLNFARPKDEGLPLVHGHTHSRDKLSEHPREFHVGVDSHDFKLVSEDTIVDWLRTLNQ